VSLSALERAIPSGELLLLDTSAIASYFTNEATSHAATVIIDSFIRSGRNRAVISSVTATELLVRPARAGRRDLANAITRFLRYFPNLEVAAIDLTIAVVAAEIRALAGMATADALIVACGLDRSAATAVSDDRGWPAVITHADTTMRVITLRSLL
jgi:predicted nucleic acid-binding protein